MAKNNLRIRCTHCGEKISEDEFETVEYRIYSPVGLYLCFCEFGVNIKWTLDLEDSVSFDSIREAKKTLNLIPEKERVEDGILIEEFREVRRKIFVECEGEK